MTPFIVIAGCMALLAAAAVAVPLVRDSRGRVIGAVAAVVLIGASAGLYPFWSNWDWRATPATPVAGPEVLAMVAKLEGRLRERPDDLKGWLMLGRSYLAMERYDDAANAYQHAHALDAGDLEGTLGLGESLSLSGGGEITPEAAQLFEQAVRAAPDNPKALLYGGFAAAISGDSATARARWLKLRAMHPPEAIDKMLAARLADLGEVPVESGAGTSAAPPPSPGAVTAPAEATVMIRIAPALRARLKAGAPLFVFARDPGAQGPPLAAKRLTVAAIGTAVHLSAADSMIPGRTLVAGRTVAITARVSFSGQPLPASGDLYGELSYAVGHDGMRELLIDRVAQ